VIYKFLFNSRFAEWLLSENPTGKLIICGSNNVLENGITLVEDKIE